MARYLEYDKTSGRILSEITSAGLPEASENCGLLEVSEDLKLDTTKYAVRDGALVKLYETNEERIERERLKQENIERIRHRIKSMIYEVCIAILDNNEDALNELRDEYKKLKVYM